MSDQNKSENPLHSDSPTTYKEAYYTDSEASVLYDVYLMLRDYGYDIDDLYPLMLAIEKLTIYEGVSPEALRWWLEIEEQSD